MSVIEKPLCSMYLPDNTICVRMQGHKGECGPMTFRDYAEWQQANNPGLYPLKGCNIVFPAMGLAGESGELLDKIKKHWRNNRRRR